MERARRFRFSVRTDPHPRSKPMRTVRSLTIAVASLVAASPAASAQFADDQLYVTDYNLSDLWQVDPAT